jgi:hypothetical protein
MRDPYKKTDPFWIMLMIIVALAIIVVVVILKNV